MATPKRQSKPAPIKPEKVRVIWHRGGKGIGGMALGPHATAALRKQKK